MASARVKVSFLFLFGALLLMGVLICAPVGAMAPPAKKISGLTVSPAFQQITVAAGEEEKSFDFSITNNTGQVFELGLSAVDFGSLDESGGVLFMGQNNTALNYKYGLRQYVSLQQDRVVVSPGATAKIPVTILNKDSLSPGGHYGAIMVTPVQSGEASGKVQVNEVVSSLLFVTKQGGETYNLGLQSYQLKTHLFSSPSAVDARFQNGGNVHLVPRGLVTITDPRGRIVKQGFINEGSGIMLPETFRKFNVPLKSTAPAWWPGVYHMVLTYHFDGEPTGHTKELAFTYVNGWYIVAGIVLMAGGILAVVSRRFRHQCVIVGRKLFVPFRWVFRSFRNWRKRT